MYADPSFLEEPGWRGDPRKRLHVSLLLAALGVLAFMSVLRMPEGLPLAPLADLVVTILPPEPEPAIETPARPERSPEPDVIIRPESAPQVLQPEAAVVDDKPREQTSATDWDAMILETVAAMGQEEARLKELRDAKWRETYSVMFQPEAEFVLGDSSPVIDDFEFKPELNVAGIGLKIGSCFVGVPLVGIPVEERTVAITVLYCAK